MKRLFSILICSLYLTVMLFSSVNTAKAETINRYGYSLLVSDGQRAAYTAMVNGIANLSDPIDFVAPGASLEDVQHAYEMVHRDYPEFFWLDASTPYTIRYSGDHYILENMPYKIDGQAVSADSPALLTAKNQVKSAISAVKARLSSNSTVYDIALVCHDYLANTVTYEEVGDHQTAYGALVSKKAVCAGYSRAYQLLLNEFGLDCWYVSGMSFDEENNLVDHGWNLVWLDGKCYYTDVTWDDQNEEVFHEYLNMSLDEISSTHITNDPLPHTCQHEDYDFFQMNSGNGIIDIRGDVTPDDIASAFVYQTGEGSDTVFGCTIHYHGDDFYTWLDEIALDVMISVGYTEGGFYGYSELGNEYHVTFSGSYYGDEPLIPPTEPPTVVVPTDAPTQPPATQPQSPQQPTIPAAPNTQPPTEPAATPETAPVDGTQPTQGDETKEPTSDTTETKPGETLSQTPAEKTNPMVYLIIGCAVIAVSGSAVLVFVLKKHK